MFGGLIVAALMAAADPGGTPPRPTTAVLGLTARTGISQDTADVVSEHVVDTLRRSQAFERVVSNSDVQTTLGLEQARQMLDCDAQSCMAEVAGALGVDLVVTGTVARLGDAFVLGVRLVNARTAVARASVSRKIDGASEERLFDAVVPVVAQLLTEAALPHTLAAPAPRSSGEGGFRPAWVGGGIAAMSTGGLLALASVGVFAAAYASVGFMLWQGSGNTILADAVGIPVGLGTGGVVLLAALVMFAGGVGAVVLGVR